MRLNKKRDLLRIARCIDRLRGNISEKAAHTVLLGLFDATIDIAKDEFEHGGEPQSKSLQESGARARHEHSKAPDIVKLWEKSDLAPHRRARDISERLGVGVAYVRTVIRRAGMRPKENKKQNAPNGRKRFR